MIRRLSPGIAFSATLALAAVLCEALPFWPFTLHADGTHPIDRMILAIVFGLTLRYAGAVPQGVYPGISFAAKRVLPLAIALMGARLDFTLILRLSGWALLINIACVIAAYACMLRVCRRMGLDEALAQLLGIGTAICGGSAIVAAAPVVRAEGRQTAIAVTAVTLLGTLAIFAFPLIGTQLEMPQVTYGVWAGTAIQAIPQVIAAGFAYGTEAGELALLVKLTRILLLAPFILYLSMAQTEARTQRPPLKKMIPPFVYGFLALSVLASLGWLPEVEVAGNSLSIAQLMGQVSSSLILLAMAAIGLESDLRGMLHSNLRVLACATLGAAALALISYGLITVLL